MKNRKFVFFTDTNENPRAIPVDLIEMVYVDGPDTGNKFGTIVGSYSLATGSYGYPTTTPIEEIMNQLK